MKPVRNLQVVCRNQVYVISDVSTVDELVDRLQRDSGISRSEILSCRVIHKGNVLEKNTSLRKAGIHDGSSVIVVTDNYRLKGKEALAIFLEMISEDSWDKMKKQMKERGETIDFDGFREIWKDSKYIKRQQVAEALRNSLDLSYRMLRGGWEHPAFRSALYDTDRIEAYRQVIDKHLSKKILGELPGAKSLVSDAEAWRRQISKITSVVIRAGDTILDGVLDVLLDVLKGAGKISPGSEYSYATNPNKFPTESQIDTTMEDPFKASDLLFELSESEDEN